MASEPGEAEVSVREGVAFQGNGNNSLFFFFFKVSLQRRGIASVELNPRFTTSLASLVAQRLKRLPAMQETGV